MARYRYFLAVLAVLALTLCAGGITSVQAQDTLKSPLLRRATIDLWTQGYRLDWDLSSDTARIEYYRIGRRIERPTGGYIYAEDELIYALRYETSYNHFPSYLGCCFPQVFAMSSIPKCLPDCELYPNCFADPTKRCLISTWSEGYQTMYQYEVKLDTCEQNYDIVWTPYNKINSYNYLPTAFERDLKYFIYASEGGERFDPSKMFLFAEADNVNSGSNRIFSMNKVDGHKRYHFVVATVYNDGRDTSFSNAQTLEYDFLPHPDMRLDSIATAQDGSNKVYFRIDVNTLYTEFILQRSTLADSGFVEVVRFNKYARVAVDTTAGGRNWFYRIAAVKSCGAVIKSSAAVSSLNLTLTAREAQNVLRWNEIYVGRGATSDFLLYRTSPDFLPLATTRDTWTIDYEAAMYSSKDYCYYVEGTAQDSMRRKIAYVRSRSVCYEAMTIWFMPNAVAPYSNKYNEETGMHRNDFRPICSKPFRFLLKIYDRWGSELYVGNNKGWNGLDNKLGASLSEGTYTYWVQVTFPNGKKEEKIGDVTVVWME